ncbi:hypothetical protein GCM10009733_072190 [Nonomuraea maheshkhaliensis]|uniref:Uncharacterized protein n=1 Tax=Nonomuraea maheshkhaliensis TaxID=419590 RepID=A0ABN2G290_9ACTN
MKTRILGAVPGIAALSGLLVPSPAPAKDGVSSARVDPARGHGGGSKSISRVYLQVSVNVRPGQWVYDISPIRDNQYT